jgi:hypothetical protein
MSRFFNDAYRSSCGCNLLATSQLNIDGLLTEARGDRLLGILDKLSTSTMNLFATVGRFEIRLTLERGTTANATLPPHRTERIIAVSDFMVGISQRCEESSTKAVHIK